MASDNDSDDEVFVGARSPEEVLEGRRKEAEAKGQVLNVGSDSDDAAPAKKPIKTEPKVKRVKTAKEGIAVVLHGSQNPPTKAHFEMVKAVKAYLESARNVEVKEVVLATTSDAYVSKKADGPYLCGEDRRTLIKLAAEEQGLGGLIQAADGSKASSGSGYIRKCYMGDYRALNVVGSDVAIKYPKPGECVVVMRGNDARSAVRSARPDAIIVPALPGFLADLSSTKVRNALNNPDSDTVVAKFCGPAVAKAMASMTRHGSAPRRR